MTFLFVMDYTKLIFLIFLTLCMVDGRGRRRSKRGNGKCNEYSFAEYNLTFYGDWSKERFPRMYPRYRPKAQWSQLIGRTHGRTYHMWSEGQHASFALQKFVEERNTMLFEREAQGYNDTRDIFTAAPITGGVGRTSLRIFADGTHSKLSFVVKLIPSPDWFVGVDSLDLCKNGHWRRKIYAHLRPMDAGTDRGFTYTSPNWPAYPREKIFQITPRFPNHPASSFYDETAERVPRIAHAIIEKVVEYRRKGNPSMGLDSSPNVVVYEQEHERQERLRLMTKPTVAGTTNNVGPDYLTKYNSAEQQRSLQMRPITSSNALLMGRLTSTYNGHQTDSKSSASSSSVLRRQSIFKNTLFDSPAHLSLMPTTDAGNQISEKTEKNNIITQKTVDSSSLEIPDPEPTSEGAEIMLSETSLPVKGVSQELNSLDLDDEDVNRIKPKLVLQKDFIMSTGDDQEKHLLDISQTEVYSNSKQQRLPDIRDYRNPTDVHVTTASQPEIVPTLSTTETDENERTIYSEAYRTDYIESFANRDKMDSLFGILSDTPSKESDLTETKTTDDEKKAEPTESLATDTQLYVEEDSNQKELHVIPLHTASRDNNRGDDSEKGNELEFRDNHDEFKGDNTLNSEMTTNQAARFHNNLYEENMKDLDCIVGEWSDWSPCSKTCGFGVKKRSRPVTQYAQNGGLPCPRLDQEALCGSMRNCRWNYFSNIFSTDAKRRRRRRKRRHHQHG